MATENIVRKTRLSNGEEYAYRESGYSSKVLLLLHGAAASSRVFACHMSKLAENFRVIAPDFRAHGLSSYKSPLKSHDDFVEDIKYLLSNLEVKNYFILGWSMGGNIAMKLAAQCPDQVEGLILLNSASPKGFAIYKVDENGNPTDQRARTKEEVYQQPGPKKMISTIAENDRERVRLSVEKCYFKNGADKSERIELYVDEWMKCKCADCLPYNSNSYNITNEHSGVTEGTNELSKIKCRILVLHGGEDTTTPKKDIEYIKGVLGELVEIKIFEKSKHMVLEDYPQETLDLIEKFCLKE